MKKFALSQGDISRSSCTPGEDAAVSRYRAVRAFRQHDNLIGRLCLPSVLLLLTCLANAQSTKEGSSPNPVSENPEIEPVPPDEGFGTVSTIHLEFKPQDDIPGASSSPAISSPILCSADGIPFISVPEPPSYTSQTVYSLDPKGAHSFSVQSAAGLYDSRFLNFFSGESEVGILVNATADPKKSQYTIESPSGATTEGMGFGGDHHEYIVEFDRNGSYKATLELPHQYSFHRVAQLPDGNLLALAYERANAVARLLLLDSEGQIVRPLEIPQGMEDDPQLRMGESGGDLNRAHAETSLSWWLFASVRQHVVLYIAHANAPFLEVGSGGAVREVPVERPEGYLVDGMVSSNDRWIVRFRKEHLSDNTQIDRRPESQNYVIYELNPGDGTLKARIDSTSSPGFGLACEKDGVLTGLSTTPDSKYLLMTAQLP